MSETCCWGNAVNKQHDDSCTPRMREAFERIAKLENMLRLANDKMAERVRQARWEVATYALADEGVAKADTRQYLTRVRDANAPKD